MRLNTFFIQTRSFVKMSTKQIIKPGDGKTFPKGMLGEIPLIGPLLPSEGDLTCQPRYILN